MQETLVADVSALFAVADAARQRARDVRRDALVTGWRSSGDRLASADLHVEVLWSVYQTVRRRDDARLAGQPIRLCRQPACRLRHCGRPAGL